jgi:hypothetical protein
MPDMTAGPWHTPWFEATSTQPARTGWYEYYDSPLDRIVLVRWDRKRTEWEWDNTARGGDLWRGLRLEARIEILERTDFIVSDAVAVTWADPRMWTRRPKVS